MKKEFLFSILMVAVLCATGFAQPDTLWTRAYGGESDDWAYCIKVTSDGGYIFAGETNSIPLGDGSRDVYVSRIDVDGNEIWAEVYGGNGQDWAESILQTDDGGFIICGSTRSFGEGK